MSILIFQIHFDRICERVSAHATYSSLLLDRGKKRKENECVP